METFTESQTKENLHNNDLQHLQQKRKYPPSIPCDICGEKMTADEAALNRKYNGRLSEERLCPVCLGKKIGMDPDILRSKIRVFQMQGCMLFSPLEETDS